QDFRDSPYLFRTGLYRMGQESLRKRLKHATLILGDVRDTVEHFFDNYSPPPTGFISLDMDYTHRRCRHFGCLEAPKLSDFSPERFVMLTTLSAQMRPATVNIPGSYLLSTNLTRP